VVEGYRTALYAAFPVTEVEISVGQPERWERAFNLGDIDFQVGVMITNR